MVTRILFISLALAFALLTQGCTTVVTPPKVTIGGGATYAEDKQVIRGSRSTEETYGPGYRDSKSYDATVMTYTLGHGPDRRECTSSQEHFRSKYSGTRGVTKTRRDGYDFWCYPAPVGSTGSLPIHPSQGMVTPRTQGLTTSGPVAGQPCEQDISSQGGWIKNGTRTCSRTYAQGNETCTVSRTLTFRHYQLVSDEESRPICRPTPIR